MQIKKKSAWSLAAEAVQQSGKTQEQETASQDTSHPSSPSQIVMIPIDKIRPGRYQKRETRDGEKYQQLKDQIKDLGFRFVATLCVSPDDSNFYNLMMGGHLRLEAALELGIKETFLPSIHNRKHLLRMNWTTRMASSMAAYCFLLPLNLYS